MSEWRTYRISDIYEGLYDGPHATPPDSDDGAVFLGISNITPEGRLNLSDIKHISEHDLPKWTKRVVPRGGDIVFSYEATLNLYAMIPEGFWGCLGRRMALIRPDNSKACGQFLYYYFFSPQWRATIQENTVVGATVDRIPLVRFPDFPVSIPDLRTQHRIADILSAYDSLIEINQRQIKLLEEAAQRLYREWFVDLRFPGHEDVPVVDGVPEGWTSVQLGKEILFEIGGGWGEETVTGKNEHMAYVIRGTDFEGLKRGEFLSIPLRFHTESSLSSRRLQHGDIIFEVSGGSRTEGVARTVLIVDSMLDRWNKPVICASFCKLIRPLHEELSLYLYDHFQYLRAEKITEEFDKRSASSIVNYRWKDFLEQRTILIPTNKVMTEFNSIAEPIYNKIVFLSLQIESARMCRDRLLPKLMSGEIAV